MDGTAANLFRIGPDIGGAFADVSNVDHIGNMHATKSPILPSDPAKGVIDALRGRLHSSISLCPRCCPAPPYSFMAH
jgi:hypothetical protein